MSLRELRQVLAQARHKLHGAPWRLDQELTGKGIESLTCAKCSWNTGGTKPVCENPACWDARVAAVLQRQADQLRVSGKKVVLMAEHYLTDEQKKGLPKGDLIRTYAYGPAKAGEKGAVEVLQVDGGNAGKLRWMKPEQLYQSNGAYSRRLNAAEKKRKEKEQKAKAAEAARLAQLLPKVKAPLSRAVRLEVIWLNFSRMWSDIRRPVLKRHGWDKLDKDYTGKKLRAEIEKLTDDQLAQLEVEIVWGWSDSNYNSGSKKKGLAELLAEAGK